MILNGFKRWLGDASWAEGRKSSAWLVGMTTFGILVLELALIRWTSGQVRVFAYVNNIVLITAFLGMGLGVALGKRYPGLVHGVLPALFLVALPVASSESLGLGHLTFPDQSITLWGAETVQADMGTFVRNLAILLTLLSGVGMILVCRLPGILPDDRRPQLGGADGPRAVSGGVSPAAAESSVLVRNVATGRRLSADLSVAQRGPPTSGDPTSGAAARRGRLALPKPSVRLSGCS